MNMSWIVMLVVYYVAVSVFIDVFHNGKNITDKYYNVRTKLPNPNGMINW